jgi:ferredoxin
LFLAVTASAIIRHRIGEAQGLTGPQNGAPSVDALSPMGGVETLWTWVTRGQLISHVQASDLVLLLASIILVLLMGSAFCGWICPLGAIQEWLSRIRQRFIPWRITVPDKLDRILRYGRYVVLALILFTTYSAGELVFGDYCPWRATAHLGSAEVAIGGVVILGLLVVANLFVERAWCRYACPLGAILGVSNKLTPVKLARNDSVCSACGLCSKQCPVGIDITRQAAITDTTCIRCLECVDSCPKPEALGTEAGWARWTTRVKGWVYGILVVAIFGGVILVSQATGHWQSTATAAAPQPSAATGLVDPLEIKGWRSLQEVSDIYGIPWTILYRELGLGPDTDPAATKAKDLEGKVAPNGTAIDVTYLRTLVAGWQAGDVK